MPAWILQRKIGGSRQIEGEKVETRMDFIFLGSEITVDGAYSHEIIRKINRRLLGLSLVPCSLEGKL